MRDSKATEACVSHRYRLFLYLWPFPENDRVFPFYFASVLFLVVYFVRTCDVNPFLPFFFFCGKERVFLIDILSLEESIVGCLNL